MERVFEWDDEKAETNYGKHGIRFEDAVLVLDDCFAISDLDRIERSGLCATRFTSRRRRTPPFGLTQMC